MTNGGVGEESAKRPTVRIQKETCRGPPERGLWKSLGEESAQRPRRETTKCPSRGALGNWDTKGPLKDPGTLREESAKRPT